MAQVRDEVTNEWEELLSRLETSWRERHEETVARYEEFIEKRTNMLTNYANSCSKKRKKAEIDEDDAAGAEVHRLAIQLRNKEGEITALGRSNASLNQSVDQLKNNLKVNLFLLLFFLFNDLQINILLFVQNYLKIT